MDLGLTGRVAFVAGASSGLGQAVALRLAREGCRVALCSRSRERIEAAAAAIVSEDGAEEGELLPLVCDVTDEGQVKSAIQETTERWGGLNILVTNAGGPPSGAATDFAPEDWQKAIELNLMSTIYLSTHAIPHLKRAKGPSRIIMVTSVAAKQPVPTLALSNTARAGVQGYAKSLADALGPEGITVNTVLPGHTRTDRLRDLAASINKRTGKSYEEVEAEWAAHTALGRIGEPEEFAAAVAFLASAPAGYITGVALPVDGGRSKHLL